MNQNPTTIEGLIEEIRSLACRLQKNEKLLIAYQNSTLQPRNDEMRSCYAHIQEIKRQIQRHKREVTSFFIPSGIKNIGAARIILRMFYQELEK